LQPEEDPLDAPPLSARADLAAAQLDDASASPAEAVDPIDLGRGRVVEQQPLVRVAKDDRLE